MAVGENQLAKLHPVKGVRLGTASAGIKTPGRKDLVVIAVDPGSVIAGVFTRNAFCAAPVQVAKAHLAALDSSSQSYLVINTGNANAGTGEQGMQAARGTCQALGELTGVAPRQVLTFSTGVIGEPLPVDKLIAALPEAIAVADENNWITAASGIMTTDTRPKGSSRQFELGGETITITGITKGAGMIKPDMATMLGFIATDISISQQSLHELVSEATEKSFNRVTVDGDTSTNDCVMLIATGQSKLNFDHLEEPEKNVFRQQLTERFVDLAQQIVRDGEGATKFVTVEVKGADSSSEALKVAYTVAESPLVKTALFASDPNWGRILAAIGRAGVADLVIEDVCVWLDNVQIVENGGRADSYAESAGQKVMNKEEITITVDLQRGECREQVWTCDFSYDYVRINAEYRS